MSELHLRVRETHLSVDLELGPGLFAFLGAPHDGLSRLFELATGLALAGAGSVLLDGRDPGSSPDLRRRIGSVWALESPLPANSVRASLNLALSLVGASCGADECLERFGLLPIADSPLPRLNSAEARSIALALALTLPSPLLLALHAPFSGHQLQQELVRTTLLARAETCPVLLFLHDARELRGLDVRVHVFRYGQLLWAGARRELDAAVQLGPGRLTVVTREAARFATLARHAVKDSSIQVAESKYTVVLSGATTLELTEQVLRLAVGSGLPLDALHSAAPTLAAIQTAVGHAHQPPAVALTTANASAAPE